MNRLPKKRKCPALRDFGVQNHTTSKTNIKHKQIPKLRKEKNAELIFRDIEVLESHEFKSQNLNHRQFPNCEKERNVELTFWDFGVRGFGVSNTKQQHTTTTSEK
jgi:hypothetical protein